MVSSTMHIQPARKPTNNPPKKIITDILCSLSCKSGLLFLPTLKTIHAINTTIVSKK